MHLWIVAMKVEPLSVIGWDVWMGGLGWMCGDENLRRSSDLDEDVFVVEGVEVKKASMVFCMVVVA